VNTKFKAKFSGCISDSASSLTLFRSLALSRARARCRALFCSRSLFLALSSARSLTLLSHFALSRSLACARSLRFSFAVHWDLHKNTPGHVLYEGEETYVDDRHFKEYTFNLEDAGVRLESYEEVFIVLTTEKCESRAKKGHAWVSGIGEQSRRGEVPHELRKGIFALSGRRVLGKGKKSFLNDQWEKQSDIMACKIVYFLTNDEVNNR
jgi:hypothetical protein